jgi:BirA family transcriptional regulator, biotin operon repressor / biotin---[acetyl-CoA-carboxylase] ligase
MSARTVGFPRLHLRHVDSTNIRARELAGDGAPDGMVVTATHQESGRGRQGRSWVAPPGRALLCSVIVRDPPRLIPLAAGVAVAETIEAMRRPDSAAAVWRHAEGGGVAPVQIKWPNDVHLRGRKVAGILVEGRPQERWAVVGVGINVAIRVQDFPPELRRTAGTLELEPASIPVVLTRLTAALQRWLDASEEAVLDAFRVRDALLGRPIRWERGASGRLGREGTGSGIDRDGRLRVTTGDGATLTLDSGEVHLTE